MSATDRRGDNDALLGLFALLAAVAVGLLFAVAVHLGVWLDGLLGGPVQHLPWHPIRLVGQLRAGQVVWPAHGWWAVAMMAAPVAFLTGALIFLLRKKRRGRERVDVAARHMGRGSRELAQLTEAGARAIAARLGVTGTGLPIADTVAGGIRLWQDFESVAIWIIGPRGGKTTSAAVPAILAAPGPVVATSNKRDSTDASRDVRGLLGPTRAGERTRRTWVFDPMGIAGEAPCWFYDPLSVVTNPVTALRFARVLVGAAREPGAKLDSYFDKAGPSLIGGYSLAAAVSGRPLTQVYDWLCEPLNQEPARILTAHGFHRSAKAVMAVIKAPEEQRGGVFGTAQELLAFLVDDAAAEWITPTAGRPAFDVDGFVRSSDTLYLLSKEGDASTGPLVSALTVAVTEAAERLAAVSPFGRLPVPLLLCLDEAANIVRWHSLPDLYSHFGSKGIVVLTFLQSWSQGVRVWGTEGMRVLWSAANVRVLGAGVSEDEWLGGLSKLIGTYRAKTRSGSTGRGSSSRGWSEHREQILDPANLAAMPKTRAVLFSTGARPVLLRPVPWMAGPHASAVEASIRAHDPAAEHTLQRARQPEDAWAVAA